MIVLHGIRVDCCSTSDSILLCHFQTLSIELLNRPQIMKTKSCWNEEKARWRILQKFCRNHKQRNSKLGVECDLIWRTHDVQLVMRFTQTTAFVIIVHWGAELRIQFGVISLKMDFRHLNWIQSGKQIMKSENGLLEPCRTTL